LSDDQETRRKRRRVRRAPAEAAEPGLGDFEPPAEQAEQAADAGMVPEGRAPKPRRSAASRVFYSLFVIFALAGLTAIALAGFGYERYITSGPLTATKVVEVKKGQRTPEIAADLEDAGVISDAKLFTAAAYLTGSRGRLKAGEYEFPAGMSMRDVLGQIVQGKSIVYKLTIPEGWTTEQALERVRDNDILTGNLTVSPPEGGLFPDTYIFRRGATRDSVVRQMMDAQQKLVADLWEKRAPDLVVKSVNEALTLASIVEKETSVPAERAKVAAVFTNRLKKGMRLQSDPTIIYGIVGGKGKLDRPLTKQDIATKTPYNTYRIDGLPPGPIANPGKASLEAVLNPAVTGDLYFVADGSGGHVFAETLAEHKKNVAKWREVERQRNAGEAEYVDELAAEKAEENAASSTEPVEQARGQPVKPPEPQIPAPPLPEGTAVTEATGSTGEPGKQKVVTPELPAVEDQPANTGKDANAADPEAGGEVPPPLEAAKPAPEKPAKQPPQPEANSQAANEPQVKPDEAAEPPPPKPDEKSQPAVEPPSTSGDTSAEQAVAAAATSNVPLPRTKPRQPPKPGDLVKVADRLVPIPVPKPQIH
jgi:UPF0755 protein